MTLSKQASKQPEPPEAAVDAHQEPKTADAVQANGDDHNPNTREEVIAYVYTGNGTQWLEGIPARDLTNGEVAQLSKDDRARLKKSDMYEQPPQTDAKDG